MENTSVCEPKLYKFLLGVELYTYWMESMDISNILHIFAIFITLENSKKYTNLASKKERILSNSVNDFRYNLSISKNTIFVFHFFYTILHFDQSQMKQFLKGISNVAVSSDITFMRDRFIEKAEFCFPSADLNFSCPHVSGKFSQVLLKSRVGRLLRWMESMDISDILPPLQNFCDT
ncbi:hypothetical protein CEXT_20651 [Caerostris extrusa]|uniref:Maturase K n=1 Tax=Caerostris extrusa TaxID=172846 RepID=A0AAV4R8H5_CAEEX|nr:hypothetical protein CEXT_20651 [Caerostris extrusa]